MNNEKNTTKIGGKWERGDKGGEGSNENLGVNWVAGGSKVKRVRGEGDGVTGGIAGGEEILPMQDGRKNKQGKIELLSQWTKDG